MGLSDRDYGCTLYRLDIISAGIQAARECHAHAGCSFFLSHLHRGPHDPCSFMCQRSCNAPATGQLAVSSFTSSTWRHLFSSSVYISPFLAMHSREGSDGATVKRDIFAAVLRLHIRSARSPRDELEYTHMRSNFCIEMKKKKNSAMAHGWIHGVFILLPLTFSCHKL